jgi:hypothetical protein
MGRFTALCEEAVGIVALGQSYYSSNQACASEPRSQTFGSKCSAAVGVSVKSQIDSSMAAAQLLKLACI